MMRRRGEGAEKAAPKATSVDVVDSDGDGDGDATVVVVGVGRSQFENRVFRGSRNRSRMCTEQQQPSQKRPRTTVGAETSALLACLWRSL